MVQLYKEGKRKCYVCKKILELNKENFFSDKKECLGLSYNCRKCNTGTGIRRKLIEEANFTCGHCSIVKKNMYGFFDIDHIKPILRKKADIGKTIYLKNEDRVNLQVLCPNCHRIKTLKERGVDTI